MFDDDSISKIIDNLILEGGIEVAGVDPETGEMLYSFTPKVKEIMPELYKEHLNEVNRDVMRLWENGFLEVDLLSEDPIVVLTDKAFSDEEIEKISIELQISLLEIKRLLIK
jgi:hypothetical protein